MSEELHAVSPGSDSHANLVEKHDEEELDRTIDVTGAITFIIGSTIGAGIFAGPGLILAHARSAGLSIISFVIAGCVALLGGATYAELGTLIQESGGEYAYLYACYGHLPAFLYSWTSNLLLKPGGLAILSLICGQYILKPFYLHETPPVWTTKGIGVAVLWAATLLNAINVREAEALLKWLTFVKLTAVGLIVILGMIHLAQGDTNAHTNLDDAFAESATSVMEITVAVINAMWVYDGWNSLNYVTEEVKNPSRTIPRALSVAVPVIMTCYVLVNLAFYSVLPLAAIADFKTKTAVQGFATTFAYDTIGTAGQIILPLLIALSTFGSLDGGTFVGSRVLYASARRGDFPKTFASIYGTTPPVPVRALFFESTLSVLFLLLGDISELVNYFAVASWLFYFATGASVIVMRWTRPNADRPFRVWLPIPIIFCCVALWLVIATIYLQPLQSAVAIATIVTGIPFYFLESRCHHWNVKTFCPQHLPKFHYPHLQFQPSSQSGRSNDSMHGINDEITV